MFNLIFSLIFIFAVALSVIIGIYRAKKRSSANSIARIIVVLFSAAFSTVLASLASWGIGKLIYIPLSRMINGNLSEILAELPSLPDIVAALLASIIAPVIFTILFLILKAILNKTVADLLVSVLEKIAKKTSRKENNDEDENENSADVAPNTGTVLSKICGAICSFLVLVVLLIPYVGSLKLAGSIGTVAFSDQSSVVSQISHAAVNNIGTKTVSVLGGDLVYSTLTTYDINGQRTSFANDGEFISKLGNAMLKDTPTEKAAAIRKAGDSLEDTTIIPTLASELINAANDDWQQEQAFHGIALPSINGSSKPAASLVASMSNSNCQTMRADLKTIINVIAVLVENDALSSIDGKNTIVALLSDETVVSGVTLELLNNERLATSLTELSNISFQIISDKLGVYENSDEAYNAFITDVYEIYTKESANVSDDMRTQRLDQELKSVFSDYGVESDDAERLGIAIALSTEFNNSDGLSHDALKAFFTEKSSVKFESSDDFVAKCSIVTSDTIKAAGGTVDNPEQESKAFAKVCSSISVVIDDVSKDSSNVALIIKDFGPVLDSFSHSKIIGAEACGKLLMATMQSAKVRSALGMSHKGATDVARSIHESSQNESYAVLMLSLSNTIKVLENKSNSQSSTEEITALMKDMTPEAAKVLQEFSTPDVIKNYGVSEESSEPVADLMSDMFGNMSEATSDPENPMSDEQYQKESEAINDMMSIAISATDSSSKNTFGEDSATGITAAEYVDRILASSIISKTLVENVYKDGDTPTLDPLLIGKELTEAEKAELTNALNEKWAQQLQSSSDEAANAEYKKQLIAIAAIVNLQISFD